MSKSSAQHSTLEQREQVPSELRTGEERNSARVTLLNPPASPAGGAPKDRTLRYVIISVLVLVGAIVAASLWSVHKRDVERAAAAAKTDGPLVLAQVDVETLQPRALSRTLPLSGTIAPLVQATVKAKVGGELQQITVFEGQDLSKGAIIARIDTRTLQAQFDREQAGVEKARADMELAKLNRDKNKTLLDQRFISQNTFESSESQYAGSAANLRLAEAQARVAKTALDDSVVRAPFAGTVAKRMVQQGEKVAPDAPMITLVDLTEMLLEAAIPAADIPEVRVGQTVRFKVSGFGTRQFEGKVQRINPTTAENSRSITVYIAVSNTDRALKGGMFAQGELLLASTEPVLAVPKTALRSESGVSVVYLLAAGKIARREVAAGAQSEDTGYVEITRGLQAGDQVIVADIRDRKPGDAAVLRDVAKR